MSLFVCEELGVCVFVLVFKIRKSGDEFMFVNRGNYCNKLELSINIYDKSACYTPACVCVCTRVHGHAAFGDAHNYLRSYTLIRELICTWREKGVKNDVP